MVVKEDLFESQWEDFQEFLEDKELNNDFWNWVAEQKESEYEIPEDKNIETFFNNSVDNKDDIIRDYLESRPDEYLFIVTEEGDKSIIIELN